MREHEDVKNAWKNQKGVTSTSMCMETKDNCRVVAMAHCFSYDDNRTCFEIQKRKKKLFKMSKLKNPALGRTEFRSNEL
jgi:hypothetical protein